MVGLSLETAKTVALMVIAVFVVGSLVVAKLVANVMGKVITILVLAGLAVLVWSQRESLDSCADKVKASGGVSEATCTFFGNDITINEGE